MSKINVLSAAVYNRIAAGEVVDRPYSVVKELVENSLDAGATEIEIEIERGGKQLIKVSDNGSGIERGDLKAAFLPHATSKIAVADDIDNVKTLGFRGEALASISSVARAEIVSVVFGCSGYKLCCDGGEMGEIQTAARDCGTAVTVRDLFFNTPVRAKFMRADNKEESDITSFVSRFILGNPYVSFKYTVDGKTCLQSYGGGLKEAMVQIYGSKTLTQCIELDAEKDGIKVSGYIGNQNFFKSNKSYQTAFLNGRFIVNNTIATAISNAYASYAMKRQFAFYVLNITVPSDIVDVNVHPNKADVRFIDNRMIFGIVYKLISSVLDGTSEGAQFVVGAGRTPEIKSGMTETAAIYAEKDEKSGNYEQSYKTEKVNSEKKSSGEFEKLMEKYKPESSYGNPESPSRGVDYYAPFGKFNSGISPFYEQKQMTLSVTDEEMPPDLTKAEAFEKFNDYKAQVQQRIEFNEFKFNGSIFNTYLMFEHRDNVYIIDQHAAHERLLYDGLMQKLKNRKIATQPLLCSYLFDTNAQETQFLERNLGVLREMGFEIGFFGVNSFRVDAIPVDLQDINIKDFIDEILRNLDDYKDIKLENILKEKLATTACKHAIKGGMALTDGEIEKLFKMLNCDWGLKCPHGRPVCVTLKKKDIEKMFKRIV